MAIILKRKTVFLFAVSVLLTLSSVYGHAEEQKPQEEIPEYFLAPEGPFKDREAYEKALAVQNAQWWPHMDLPMQRTHVLYEACQKDLEVSGSDVQTFLPTKCGLLMQGYSDASMVMFYTLIDGIGKKNGEIIVRQKPFCPVESINIIDMAKIFVSHVQQNPKKLNGETYRSISTALTNKYPCPWHIERKNR